MVWIFLVTLQMRILRKKSLNIFLIYKMEKREKKRGCCQESPIPSDETIHSSLQYGFFFSVSIGYDIYVVVLLVICKIYAQKNGVP